MPFNCGRGRRLRGISCLMGSGVEKLIQVIEGIQVEKLIKLIEGKQGN